MTDIDNGAASADTPTDAVVTDAPTTPAAQSEGVKPASTMLDGDESATTDKAAAPSDWPDDWRQKYAGENEKVLKRLERYNSPKAALDALIAAQDKISRGDLRKPLGDKPSDDELAAYRADNGIPESPDKYDLKLSDGRVIGEEDKELVGSFLEQMHGKNATPEQVSAGVDWYYGFVEEQQAKRYEADEEYRRQSEDELRAEFGADFRRNMNMVSGLLQGAPEGVREMLMDARTEDGTRLINSPNALRWLTQLSREINPVSAVVPGAGANAGQAISDELDTIKSLMGDPKSEYWKGPKAEKMQARFRDLVNAQGKMK